MLACSTNLAKKNSRERLARRQSQTAPSCNALTVGSYYAMTQVEVVSAVLGDHGALSYDRVMRQGEVFACREMLTKSTHRKIMRARGHVELLALTNADLIEVLGQFPDVYQRVHQYATKQYNYNMSLV